MSNIKETLELALEALENSVDLVSQEARNAEELYGKYPTRLARIQGLVAFEVAHEKAITALREALASGAIEQPAQFVAWMEMVVANLVREGINKHKARELAQHFLYTSPPTLSLAQRQARSADTWVNATTWRGLTDEEITDIWAESSPYYHEDDFARAIEARLKAKNSL